MTTDDRAPSIERLVAILTDEHRCYMRLTGIAEAQREALITSDIERLAPLVREIEGIAAEIERLEQARAAVAAVIADSIDGPVTLTALMQLLPAEARPELEEQKAALLNATDRLRALNDLNAGLVRQALALTDGWSRLMQAALHATYDPSGTVGPPRITGKQWAA